MSLSDYSNMNEAQRNATKYDKQLVLKRSTRKDKKYMITANDKTVHFGQMGYEDYTKHKDEARRESYLKRAQAIRGNWRKDKYSPNNLAINILWR